MLTRVRNRLAGEPQDAGVTLVEVLMAMALSTILGAVTLMLFVQVSASANDTTDRTISSSQARNALQSWSSYLQVIDDAAGSGSSTSRFEWITDSSIMFYADLNNRSGAVGTTAAASMIWLRLDSAGQLVEERFPGTPTSYPATATSCRILVFRVSATRLFSAYNLDGANLSATLTAGSLGTAPAVSSGCQKLPSAPPSKGTPSQTVVSNLKNVISVNIDFTTTDVSKKHTLTFHATITLPKVTSS